MMQNFNLMAIATVLLTAANVAEAKGPDLRGFDDVKTMIEANDVTSLNHLLKLLPDEFLGNYVLMTKTQSSHLATELRPRVIMMNEDARLILAFSGALNDPNYEVLEMIEFNDEARFVFHEIKFPRRFNTPPIYSEANPSRCLDCHGTNPRPNWEPDIAWPGAVGERKLPSELDLNTLHRFAVQRSPRYAALDAHVNRKQVAAGNETCASQLSTRINRLNARRVAHMIVATPEYERYRYAIAAGLLDAPDLLNCVPFDRQSGRTHRNYQQLLTETACSLSTFLPRNTWGSSGFGTRDLRIVTNLRYLLETRGVAIDSYSTSPTNGFFLTGNGELDGRQIVYELYQADPVLAERLPLPANFLERVTDCGRTRFSDISPLLAQLRDESRLTFTSLSQSLPNLDATQLHFEIGECPEQKPDPKQEQAEKLARQQKQPDPHKPQTRGGLRPVFAQPAKPHGAAFPNGFPTPSRSRFNLPRSGSISTAWGR